MKENYFRTNIKLLRSRRGRTQDDVAVALDLKRGRISGYENGVAEPGIEVLMLFSSYFKISIDTLLKIDLSKLGESDLSQLERGNDVFINGSTLRILTTTVNNENRDNIELVNHKVSAGYKTGFADPEYISELPSFQLPFLSPERKYRTFQINGDSMSPIPHGSWVTGEYLQNWQLIQDGQAHIILTQADGIMFKVVDNLISEEGRLRLSSLNHIYQPYYIDIKDVREIWRFVHYINSDLPESIEGGNDFIRTLSLLKKDLAYIKTQLKYGNSSERK